jgi:hypothetical protein
MSTNPTNLSKNQSVFWVNMGSNSPSAGCFKTRHTPADGNSGFKNSPSRAGIRVVHLLSVFV